LSIVKFDHIAIVVDDLDEALDHFRELFDIDDAGLIYERDYDDVDADTGSVDVMHFALFPVGQVYLELIEPVSEGPMKRFLESSGGGLHHIGITTDDLRSEWKKHHGAREKIGVIGDRPRVDQYKVSYWFLHPKDNHRVLWEVDAAWAKTSASDMTPVERTPDWEAELGSDTEAAEPA
jgi:methylmalonyl-CoA/ethylmalonyl-CoA epimerase